MKKSSIKYFGVTAAALLAVSPVAAPVFSQATQGNTVAAAEKTAAEVGQTVLNNLQTQGTLAVSSTNITKDSFDKAYSTQTRYTNFSNSENTGDVVASILNPYFSITNQSEQSKDAKNTYQFKQVDGWSAEDTANTIANRTKETGSSYPVNFVVTVKSEDGTTTSKNVTITFTNSQVSTGSAHVDFTAGVAKKGESTYNYTLGYEAVKSLKMTDEKGNVMTPQINSLKAQIDEVSGVSADKKVIDTDKNVFKQYGTAVQTLNFTVPVAVVDGQAQVPNTINGKNKSGNNFDLGNGVVLTQGTTSEVKDNKATVSYTITRNVQVYAADVNAQPFFAISNVSVPNNTLATLPSTTASDNSQYDVKDGAIQATAKDSSIDKIVSSLNNAVKAYAGDQANTSVSITKDSVVSALTSAGATIDKNQTKVNGLSGRNVFTLTVSSPINQKEATIRFVVNFQTAEDKAKEDNQPRIKFASDNYYKDGETTKDTDTAVIFQGQDFKPYDAITVYENNGGTNQANAPQIDKSKVSVGYQSFNNNVPGDYKVTYSVTNSQGLTSTVTRNVKVLALNNVGIDKVVNFVPGYGVMVWSATDNSVNATSDFVQHGTTVKTFDTKTVDGVSYTRINSANSNQWVQSKYFDANANNAPQTNNNTNTNTDSNQETPFEGTLTIKYVPGYRVFLRDGQANMQQQSVGDGEAYKVWAKKTVGNHTYYRIGTDAQWIEDTYAQF